ncbi:MAG: acyl-CoA dehydrogenase family protein [Leptolyngbyaceae cyanobacterium bins.349]|nr:acyl-CoA dehydrogenase family protein [Leptolyngbyaceae cyanobacterium bins.349]
MFSLDLVEIYLRDRVAPHANQLDHSVDMLRQAFHQLGEQHWLGLKIPTAWGGCGLTPPKFQQVQELMARYSGALAFLQAQHQSAGGLLSRSENEPLKRHYLPQMVNGAIAVGVGFSHLRRSPPPFKAVPVPGGFQLDGTIPWITGFELFQTFVGAAVLPDDRAVYGILPFCNTHQTSGSIHFSAPLPLAGMTATNTVTAEVRQWFLPDDQVVFIQPANAIGIRDRQNVLQHSCYALGCAQAGLDLIQQQGRERSQLEIHQAHQTLSQELHQCRAAIYAAQERSFEERLQLRAWAIELAVRCAHVAVTLAAGMANSLQHPAQRIYREAMVFTVTGQTKDVMLATLSRLVPRR